MKALIALLFCAMFAFAETPLLTTVCTSRIDLVKGRIENDTTKTTLNVGQNGRIVHTTPTVTSVYVYTGEVATLQTGDNKILAVATRSEVGNHYFWVFDFANGRVLTYPEDGSFMVQYDIRIAESDSP